jgi:ATP-dependent protease HslVU (ClpYQ) peptidase subunit
VEADSGGDRETQKGDWQMTCIVGLEADGKVFMGGDSASTSGWDLDISRFRKVFRVGDFLVGCTGTIRMEQLLQYSLEVRSRENDEDDIRYMVLGLVEAIRKCLKDGGFAKVEDNQEKFSGQFLVGFNGRLYTVEQNFQVCSSASGFWAIGCGADFALGNLLATRGMEPRGRVMAALEAAGRFSAGVHPPYYVECLEC